MALPYVWLIAVSYDHSDAIGPFLEQVSSGSAAVRVTIAENAETPISSTQFPERPWLEIVHYPDNPGYFGAVNRIMSAVKLEDTTAQAVVVCNLDVGFDVDELIERVESYSAEYGQAPWIMAPRIRENGYRFEGNPIRSRRPDPFHVPAAFRMSSSLLLFTALSILSNVKRRFATNKDTSRFLGKPIYWAHGSFFVFGRSYFGAGGTVPDVPLTNEEYSIAEIAHLINCPIILDPSFWVEHYRGVTTSGFSLRAIRQRHEFFRNSSRYYRTWDAGMTLTAERSKD